ncbi:MAG: cell division protein FtsA [Alphaproteobacteria bacterium]|nr:cell division protein FtsA [Alphaproteobacteria bacterium]
MKPGQIIAVVDIGSTKVCCCIASVAEDGHFDILGVGYCVCFGMKHGMIVDMGLVSRCIARSVENAEKTANLRIKSVYVNVSGKFVKSELINSEINIGGRIIKNEDIEKLVYQGTRKNSEVEVIHSIPILFELDSMVCTADPVGMFANVLKANVNVVTVPKVQINNIVISLSRCHLDVLGVVYGGYASGLSVLNDESKQDNQIVVDFGGGITTVNFFFKGVFCGLEVVPIGGQNITKDIAYGINVSRSNAERLKTLHGEAFESFDDKKNMILVPMQEENNTINLQQMTKSDLNVIIQPRVEEIFGLIKEKIDNSVFKSDFARRFVITGGGSMLTGMREFMFQIFKKPVDVKKVEDRSEIFGIQIGNDFSTALGMIKFALMSDNAAISPQNNLEPKEDDGLLKKAINWIENNL